MNNKEKYKLLFNKIILLIGIILFNGITEQANCEVRIPSISSSQDTSDIFDKDYVLRIMKKVNNYQFNNPWTDKEDYNWIRGTYYTGVMAAYQATGDKQYLKQANRWGEKFNWNIQPIRMNSGGSGVNVLTSAQTWLESYMLEPDIKKIHPVIEYLITPYWKNPVNRPYKWHFEGGRRYVDGLYTGPPALAMLFKITGKQKYADWLEFVFWDVHNQLYDEDTELYYRDYRFNSKYKDKVLEKYYRPDSISRENARSSYVYQYSPNGKKVLWSRGNGWAFAGIARILKYLPVDYPERNKYLKIFKEMAESLKDRQLDDGYWRMNLDDPEDYSKPETSGTAFFIYGMAMGINNDWLSSDEYQKVVEKGWKALCNAVSPEGKVQWGQPVGAGPYQIYQEDSHEYVSGMFLLAASEIYKLAD